MKENYVYPAIVRKMGEEIEVSFLDFPDLIAVADDENEIIRAAQEVLALTILDYVDQGKKLPEPSMASGNIIYIHVWMHYFKNTTKEIYVKKSVTIPQWLDILAKERNINFSAALVKGVKKELGIEEN